MSRNEIQPPKGWYATFGPFQLHPDERLLQRGGAPVRLGGRALDLLIALVEDAGTVVGKKELLAKVWDGVIVDEGSLRFNMFAMRKALGDGEGGQRYVVNTANKGYTFVAAVQRHFSNGKAEAGADRPTPPAALRQLPALGSAIVGRDAEIETIVAGLLQRRLMSIVGSGGTGKTTVAIASAQASAAHFGGEVHFVDLSQVSAEELVRTALASAIGLQTGRDDLDAITAHLAQSQALIVLDCCEHVIAGAAELSEALVRNCPAVHVLATSREPLLADAEFVFRLQPLGFPLEGEAMTAEQALAYPAVRLFVDRAAASGSGFALTDHDAPLVSQLCRELDGIALAIELAAGRMEALGLKAITSHFDASAKLLWHGRRMAVPRHQTLGATLDWSYTLLADEEKRLLRRLSVFAGTFSIDAAIEICCFDQDQGAAIELIAGLVSKSLLGVDAGGETLRYRMLDTTKAYGRRKLVESGEFDPVMQRFCDHFAAWTHGYGSHAHSTDASDLAGLELPNVRAALDQQLRGEGELKATALELAASLCAMLLKVSRLSECRRWAELALGRLPANAYGSRAELKLQGALGQSLMFTGGDVDAALLAFTRSIELAGQLHDSRSQLHLLNGHAVLLHREGRYAEALSVARRAQALLGEVDDAESRAIVDSLMGVALHLVGDVGEALQYFEKCAGSGGAATVDISARLGFDHHIRALCGIARTLWLTGRYARAVEVAEEAIAKAASGGHAATQCIALIWAGSVFTYAADDERVLSVADALERVATRHSLLPYLNVANVIRGHALIARGQAAEGVERIQTAMAALSEFRYRMISSVSLSFLAKGFSELALHAAAIATCEDAERMIRAGGDFLRLPDLWAVKGCVQAAAGRRGEAQDCWRAAIDLARTQGMVSTELRASVELATHWAAEGKSDAANALLRPLVIAAGDETSADLTLARRLLG